MGKGLNYVRAVVVWVSRIFGKKTQVRYNGYEERDEKKAQHPVGFEPMTSWSRHMSSITEQQPISLGNFLRGFIPSNQVRFRVRHVSEVLVNFCSQKFLSFCSVEWKASKAVFIIRWFGFYWMKLESSVWTANETEQVQSSRSRVDWELNESGLGLEGSGSKARTQRHGLKDSGLNFDIS